MNNDSVDKVVQNYFSAVTATPFTYKNVEYHPKPLKVSPGIMRGFTCPVKCGGCCPKFTLDYLPGEDKPADTVLRQVEFNGKSFAVHTDLQTENKGFKCRHLNWENGRCGIYTVRPFSCDFELIRFMNRVDAAHVTQRLFGRGWAMRRVDGGRGALCTITPATENDRNEAIRKMSRLKDWTDHFQIDTKIPNILKWLHEIELTETEALIV
jgi:Fe-S-cluster containining protein